MPPRRRPRARGPPSAGSTHHPSRNHGTRGLSSQKTSNSPAPRQLPLLTTGEAPDPMLAAPNPISAEAPFPFSEVPTSGVPTYPIILPPPPPPIIPLAVPAQAAFPFHEDPAHGGEPVYPNDHPEINASPAPSHGHLQVAAIAGAIVGIVGFLLAMGILVIFYKLRMKTKKESDNQGESSLETQEQQEATGSSLQTQQQQEATGPSLQTQQQQQQQEAFTLEEQGTITLKELLAATSEFSEANILGKGGFGTVYRGILPNGDEIAVKKLAEGSGQGDVEFRAEVDILTQIRHTNLVSLIGYCVIGKQRLLAYEFVPNGTLEFHLHSKERPGIMAWAERMRVAMGLARGLAYLHEECTPRIIHRDVKPSNILIGMVFEPKIADFGLAKTLDNQTHVTTDPKGTVGYVDPEYYLRFRLTEKSDVYSLGVILLELVTGRPAVDRTRQYHENLVWTVKDLLQQAVEERDFDNLVDPGLNGQFNLEELARTVACADACIQQAAHLRPRMTQVAGILEGSLPLDLLNKDTPPATSGSSVDIPEEEEESAS